VALGARAMVPVTHLQRRLGMAVATAGNALADKVLACVHTEKLDYVPALEYFSGRPCMDVDVFKLVVRAADVACEYVAREAQDRLWPLFSNLHIENVHAHAFTMPRVNPKLPDAMAALIRHYSLNDVRLELVVSAFERNAVAEGYERFAAQKVIRGLRDSFDDITISSAKLMDA
jgi:hypothetical protein